MKQLTLIGYYTSQIGFEQELHGEIIPVAPRRLRPSGRGGGEISMATKTYDAIVVGSGITGGWAAKELGEKGLQTLVLEAGRPIDPDTGLRGACARVGSALSRDERPQAGAAKISRCRKPAAEWTSGTASFSSTTSRILTPPNLASLSCGFAAARWVGVRSSGDGNPIAGAILILKPTSAKGLAWIGRSAIRKLLPGTTTWKISSASPASARDFRSCRTAIFCRPWN